MAPRWEWSHARRGELMVLVEIRRCSYEGGDIISIFGGD